MDILVTGAAGFIGFHTAKRLLEQGHRVLGFDSVNNYYDILYKQLRLDVLKNFDNFRFVQGNIEDANLLQTTWRSFSPSHVIHLAAQAGVRYSIENPHAYISANIVGFQNVVELVRATKPVNFLYASSSSVYGGNKQLPFSENQDVSNPISLYAATKIANELVCKSYANLFGMPGTGFRFFTVYGPYGRPDMAMFKFAKGILEGSKLPVFNSGKMIRDFTYIDDIVDGIEAALARPEPGQVYNLGRGKKELLFDMISALESAIGKKANLEFLPMQLGDVEATESDISRARANLGYQPKTDLRDGIVYFVQWYLQQHGQAKL